MTWLTGWKFRKEITIQDTNVDGNLTDFPSYIFIDADADFHEARSDGYDIRFTEDDGETLLKYEREYWAGGNGSAATAHFWVKVPSILASGGATIYLYYGKVDAGDGEDAENVWDGNFLAVYHLNESTGACLDSTVNGNNGTYTGNVPDPYTGKIHLSQDFDGTDDYIVCTGPMPTLSGNWTMTCWADGDGNRDHAAIAFVETATSEYVGIGDNGSGYLKISTNGETPGNGSTLLGAGFNYLGASHDGTKLYGIQNGAQEYNVTPTGVDWKDANQFWIGARQVFNDWDGRVDEVRVSDIKRVDEWLKFEYHNIAEVDQELTWNTEEKPTISINVGEE